MLATLHHVLIQCQELGDQKVRLTGQIMEILSSKTRQLGLDTKSLGKSCKFLSPPLSSLTAPFNDPIFSLSFFFKMAASFQRRESSTSNSTRRRS